MNQSLIIRGLRNVAEVNDLDRRVRLHMVEQLRLVCAQRSLVQTLAVVLVCLLDKDVLLLNDFLRLFLDLDYGLEDLVFGRRDALHLQIVVIIREFLRIQLRHSAHI